MTDVIRIIAVEDNDSMYESYYDAALDFSTDGLRIEIIREIDADSAKSSLLSNSFDGAIVDLNLSQIDPGEASGNSVLREIVDKHRFPVFVVSGNLHNVEEDLREKESGFLRFYDRDTENEIIFSEMIRIFKTGITKILGGRGKIEKSLGEIFWAHLSDEFDVWSNGCNSSERTLLRYTISHLTEYLDIPDGESHFYHEAEFYIKPPIRNHIATGDIIELQNKRYMILSPACDVAVRDVVDDKPVVNASMIVLAPLIKINRDSFIANGLMRDSDNSDLKKRIIDEIIKGKRDKLALLPGYGKVLYPAVVDFQNIHSYPLDRILESTRVATVSGVFLKDIQSRFSAYFGRQGQPDLDKKELLKTYKALLSENSR